MYLKEINFTEKWLSDLGSVPLLLPNTLSNGALFELEERLQGVQQLTLDPDEQLYKIACKLLGEEYASNTNKNSFLRQIERKQKDSIKKRKGKYRDNYCREPFHRVIIEQEENITQESLLQKIEELKAMLVELKDEKCTLKKKIEALNQNLVQKDAFIQAKEALIVTNKTLFDDKIAGISAELKDLKYTTASSITDLVRKNSIFFDKNKLLEAKIEALELDKISSDKLLEAKIEALELDKISSVKDIASCEKNVSTMRDSLQEQKQLYAHTSRRLGGISSVLLKKRKKDKTDTQENNFKHSAKRLKYAATQTMALRISVARLTVSQAACVCEGHTNLLTWEHYKVYCRSRIGTGMFCSRVTWKLWSEANGEGFFTVEDHDSQLARDRLRRGDVNRNREYR